MAKQDFSLSDFDFDLPEEQIAQSPVKKRDESKLYLLDRNSGASSYDIFSNISSYLKKGDLLVFNNARVIPARMYFVRETGGRVEVVLARMLSRKHWLIITNRTKKLGAGETLHSEKRDDISFEIKSRKGEYLEVEVSQELSDEVLQSIGEMPLPPYIKRDVDDADDERYQTVYAKESGAVAAPTAGLHFTNELMNDFADMGVEKCFVTLYVSWGTFSPVRSEKIREHTMHTESYVLSEEAAALINKARNEGRRIIAVGTTSLRVLESSYDSGSNRAGSGETDIFIYPPYEVKSVDGLITNFHTPKSTLLMLICAFAGYENVMHAYKDAVAKKFRFFSYGDSMFIR